MANVLWLQGGACSGNTMSFLNAEEPTVVELIVDFGINILWHPTVGLEIGHQVSDLMNEIVYKCQQMFGGYGFMEEYPIGRIYRDVRVVPICTVITAGDQRNMSTLPSMAG